jgi:hypothetical protein
MHRIRESRGGALYDGRFGVRQRGGGALAAAIGALFEAGARRAGLATLPCAGGDRGTPFRRPRPQLDLFSDAR